MRIILTGRSGSGKSTLLNLLANNGERLPVISETAREVLNRFPEQSVYFKQVKMLYRQWIKEEDNKDGIFDRSLIDYVVFSKRIGIKLPFYDEQLYGRYNMVLKMPNRPFKNDGVRIEKDEDEASEIQGEIDQLYHENAHALILVPNIEMSGQYRFVNGLLQKIRGRR